MFPFISHLWIGQMVPAFTSTSYNLLRNAQEYAK